MMQRCCLCGCRFEGEGHNPDPLGKRKGDRCCTSCNSLKVIPARLGLLEAKE